MKVSVLLLLCLVPSSLMAYEESMDPTPKGEIEVKVLPGLLALEAATDTSYFEGDNRLFRKLFRYISDKGIAMTTPVEVRVDPGRMRFFVGENDADRADESTETVDVVRIPARTVASIGFNGAYNQKNYEHHLAELEAWLEANAGAWRVAGEPSAIYWDGPFKLGAFKSAEIHIPVRTVVE